MRDFERELEKANREMYEGGSEVNIQVGETRIRIGSKPERKTIMTKEELQLQLIPLQLLTPVHIFLLLLVPPLFSPTQSLLFPSKIFVTLGF